MPKPIDWTDKDPIIRKMRTETPPKTWTDIAAFLGITREVVRQRAKYHLPECYEETRIIRNR